MSESKSELKRLCTLDPVGMAHKMWGLEQENAELKLQHAQAIEQLKSYEQLFKDATKAVEENAELKRIIAESQKPLLEKHQPCGCVVCTCENDEQCQGCGSRHCGTHEVGKIPNPLFASPVIQEGMLNASKE